MTTETIRALYTIILPVFWFAVGYLVRRDLDAWVVRTDKTEKRLERIEAEVERADRRLDRIEKAVLRARDYIPDPNKAGR